MSGRAEPAGLGDADDGMSRRAEAEQGNLHTGSIEPGRLRTAGEVEPDNAVTGGSASTKLRRRRVMWIDGGEPGITRPNRGDRSHLSHLTKRPVGRVHQPDATRKVFERVRHQVDTGRIEIGDG